MDWDTFTLGFWHPFGAYCGLTAREILDWKGGEATRNGWTLWSFAYTPSMVKWHAILEDHPGPVYVLCSDSPSARDPKPCADPPRATHYRTVTDADWRPMPDQAAMYVTNPFKRGELATAFIVRRVVTVDPIIPPFTVSWYSSKPEDRWRDDLLPSRPEFLIRRGGSVRLRRVAAVLELQPPYLAILKRDVVNRTVPEGVDPVDIGEAAAQAEAGWLATHGDVFVRLHNCTTASSDPPTKVATPVGGFVMPEITLESLAARLAAVEKQLAEVQKQVTSPPIRPKDWRRTIGMFANSELAQQVDAEIAADREAEREAARNAPPEDSPE